MIRNLKGKGKQRILASRIHQKKILSSAFHGTQIVSDDDLDSKRQLQGISKVPPRWPVHKIISRGVYKDERFLEDIIGGSLYEKQKSLPSLPIPDIKDSIKKLLSTALPLSESKEETSNFLSAADAFEVEAQELQTRLQRQKDLAGNETSWLSIWWNQLCYLQYREPVVINVSYFYHLNVRAKNNHTYIF